jgi:hypothetical protein
MFRDCMVGDVNVVDQPTSTKMVCTISQFPYDGTMIMESLPRGQTGFLRTGESFRGKSWLAGTDNEAVNLRSTMPS